MSDKRIAWAITGAGHNLNECVGLLRKCERIDLFLSRAAEEVLSIYSLDSHLETAGMMIYREVKASSPIVGRFFGGAYSVLVVAPATSNSVAKFVGGISDTLVTNLFAQAGKSRVPVVVFPTDLATEMNSVGPHRKQIKVFPRAIDLDNVEKLRTFSGVDVVADCAQLERCLAAYR